jgi:DNA-binding GntR family transcriptional regulator
MTQLGLLEYRPPVVAPSAPEQARQAARVGGRIDLAVIAWCARHRGQFHLADFTRDIVAEIQCAPDSPRRRLAALVEQGHVQAVCVDRSKSLWAVAAGGDHATGP